LSLHQEYRRLQDEFLHRDLIKLYLQRLRWNLELFEKPIIFVAKTIRGLKLDNLSDEEEVLGALCAVRRSRALQAELVTLPAFRGRKDADFGFQPGDVELDEKGFLQVVSGATCCDEKKLDSIHKRMQQINKMLVENVKLVTLAHTGDKRPREDEPAH
jgi:hypothetical protein